MAKPVQQMDDDREQDQGQTKENNGLKKSHALDAKLVVVPVIQSLTKLETPHGIVRSESLPRLSHSYRSLTLGDNQR